MQRHFFPTIVVQHIIIISGIISTSISILLAYCFIQHTLFIECYINSLT